MSSNSVAHLPKSISRLRIAQIVLSIFVLGLTAYLEYYYEGDYQIIFPLATSIFTLLIIGYYFIARNGPETLYSWVLLFLLECIAVASWITSTVLAALLCRRIVHLWHGYEEYEEYEEHEEDYGESDPWKREEEHVEYEEYEEYEEYDGIPFLSYVSTSSVIVGLCGIQLILYGVTLTLMFIHRNRKASRATEGKSY